MKGKEIFRLIYVALLCNAWWIAAVFPTAGGHLGRVPLFWMLPFALSAGALAWFAKLILTNWE